MKSLSILFVTAIVFLLSGFTINHVDTNAALLVQSNSFYYPSSTLKTIMSQGNGLRLYNGYFPSNGGETLMAVSVSGERDNQNVNYYLATASGGANIIAVEKGVALEGCRNLESGKRFAITIGENDVNQLLNQTGSTGISFEYASTDMGYRTLKVSPANIGNGTIANVNQDASFLIRNPCPISCGSDVQSNYLCDMQ